MLINNVLSSIPLYLFQSIHPPKWVINKLESMFANFF